MGSTIFQVTRRTFLTEVSRGMFAIAVFGVGVAACATESDDPTTSTGDTSPAAGDPTTSTTGSDSTTTSEATTGGVAVERVDLGFVSAYVLVRAGEAAIVDTGIAGSEGDIEAGLSELGLSWGNVGNVVLTHLHPDHIGSLGAVMDSASQADGFAGEADIPSINSPRPLTAVGDGDRVFGLEIIETPGHTPGSISIHDPIAGVLVVGDAMNGTGSGVSGDESGVAGANPRFSSDMDTAGESIKKLAALDFDSVYFGHGEPVESNASALVTELAATA